MRKIYGSSIRLCMYCVFFLGIVSSPANAKHVSSDFVIERGLHSEMLDESGFFLDSTSVQKATRDLNVLKRHVGLSEKQEAEVAKIFENKYAFLETPHTSQGRKQLTFRAFRREFEMLFNAVQLEILNEEELVDFWFKLD